MYRVITEFVTYMKVDWKKCISFCSDGAKPMVGRINGVGAVLASRLYIAAFIDTHWSQRHYLLPLKKFLVKR